MLTEYDPKAPHHLGTIDKRCYVLRQSDGMDSTVPALTCYGRCELRQFAGILILDLGSDKIAPKMANSQ